MERVGGRNYNRGRGGAALSRYGGRGRNGGGGGRGGARAWGHYGQSQNQAQGGGGRGGRGARAWVPHEQSLNQGRGGGGGGRGAWAWDPSQQGQNQGGGGDGGGREGAWALSQSRGQQWVDRAVQGGPVVVVVGGVGAPAPLQPREGVGVGPTSGMWGACLFSSVVLFIVCFSVFIYF